MALWGMERGKRAEAVVGEGGQCDSAWVQVGETGEEEDWRCCWCWVAHYREEG